MTKFLAELYIARAKCDATAEGWERLRRAAAELTAEGRPVRPVRSIFVPEDETCFLLVEAVTVDDVHEAARRAELACDHVAEAAVELAEAPAAEGSVS